MKRKWMVHEDRFSVRPIYSEKTSKQREKIIRFQEKKKRVREDEMRSERVKFNNIRELGLFLNLLQIIERYLEERKR